VSRSMISADCIIEGTVINSILSPGVIVKKGAIVRDSIIFHDSVIESRAKVDLAILDKRSIVGRGATVGNGDEKNTPNRLYPKHLYTGITLIGKEAVVPPKTVIGRNCIVHPYRKLDDFFGLTVKTGETV
jgi:glucose-1-phosphate adenylyltransferase